MVAGHTRGRQYVTSQSIDALIAAADNTVCMGPNASARVAGDSKAPLFVRDPERAKKGAAVGMGVNYKRWDSLSGMKAAQILKGLRVERKIEPITETELLVNKEACKAQGLTVPQSVLERATNIVQ